MDDTIAGEGLTREIRALAASLDIEDRGQGTETLLLLISVRVAIIKAHDRASMLAAETLRIASIELTRNFDVDIVLEGLLDYLAWLLPYDCAKVHLLAKDGTLMQSAVRDFKSQAEAGHRLNWPDTEEVKSALAQKESAISSSVYDESRIAIHLVVPLLWENEALGLISAERLDSGFSEEQVHYAEALASQAAVAIHNAHLFSELKRADIELIRSYDATIEGWSRALELRDHDTEGHTLRVTEMSLRLGKEMALSEDELTQMRRGALLHDIGKVAIPDAVLLKPSPLNTAEREIMKRHPEYARRMLENIAFLAFAIDIPYCHHEKWDGSGYPQGLAGTNIPLPARIFAIVDVWDALTHDRPYHLAWTKVEVIAYLRTLSGLHFDPVVVKAFLSIMEQA